MSSGASPKKLRTFDEDDIVRYSLGLDVPIVGLVRDRHEYKEMREMALIHGTVLGLGKRPRAATPAAASGESAHEPSPAAAPSDVAEPANASAPSLPQGDAASA